MRSELYADSRDEWKWSVVTTTASENSQSIRWIVMLREDIGQHGQNWEPVPQASSGVTAFFQQERQLILNGTPRDLTRISILSQRLGIPIDMNMTPYPASLSTRDTYIGVEVSFLDNRAPERRDVVFADPDNGVGQSEVNGKQFHETHVLTVWQALRSGDTFAVVQFQWNERNWVQQRRQNLAGLLGIPVQRITPHHWDNVCIYVADR